MFRFQVENQLLDLRLDNNVSRSEKVIASPVAVSCWRRFVEPKVSEVTLRMMVCMTGGGGAGVDLELGGLRLRFTELPMSITIG